MNRDDIINFLSQTIEKSVLVIPFDIQRMIIEELSKQDAEHKKTEEHNVILFEENKRLDAENTELKELSEQEDTGKVIELKSGKKVKVKVNSISNLDIDKYYQDEELSKDTEIMWSDTYCSLYDKHCIGTVCGASTEWQTCVHNEQSKDIECKECNRLRGIIRKKCGYKVDKPNQRGSDDTHIKN